MREFIAKALRKIGKVFYRNLTDNLADLRREESCQTSHELVPGLRIERLDRDRVESLRPGIGDKQADDFLERLDASDGFVIFDDGDLCGWIWGSDNLRPREGVPPLIYPVRPPPGVEYIFFGLR